MNRAHVIRLNPTPEQEVYFRKACGVARHAYNWALARWKDYRAEGKWVKMKDLKAKTIRGGLARLGAQGANFFFRLASLMVLARLLGPNDFGLVGMVTAFTGVLGLFRDFGLSSAAIQHAEVTND